MNNLKQKLGTLVLGVVVIGVAHFLNPVNDDGIGTAFAPQLENTPIQLPGAALKLDRADEVDLDPILTAFQNRQSDLIVEGQGTVVKLLPDDNEGSRHQRFLLRLDNKLTLLVAHNIDLAPRVSGIREGELLSFKGEYEWNNKGGVLHWTHHDPRGSHEDGWLEYRGKRFQ